MHSLYPESVRRKSGKQEEQEGEGGVVVPRDWQE